MNNTENKKPLIKFHLSEEEKTVIKTHLNDKNYKVIVEFKKTDNSIRVMNCTTSEEIIGRYLPEKQEKIEKPIARKKNEDVQIVFDTDKKEWRSFRWDSVISLTTTNEQKYTF